MSTAAKLGGEVAHLDHTNGVAVLFAEERHCAFLLCGLDVGFLGYDGRSKHDLLINVRFYAFDLFGSESLEVREVEAADLVAYVGACLLNVVTENTAESRLKKVSRGVVTHNVLAVEGINNNFDAVANFDGTALNLCKVDIYAIRLLSVVDTESVSSVSDGTGIADLSAALAVAGGLVQNNRDVALGYLVDEHIVNDKSDDLSLGVVVTVADKFGFGEIGKQILRGIRPTADVSASGSCSCFLFLHKSSEAVVVDGKTCFLRDLTGEVDREAEGVVELEYVVARDGGDVLLLCGSDKTGKDRKTRIDGSVEALLLDGENTLDVVSLCRELRVCATALADSNLNYVNEEGMIDAEELTVAASATDDSAENVAAALVGGDNGVGDHKHCGADVVGDNADRNIVVLIIAVLLAGDLANLTDNLLNGVDLEHIVNALHYASKALKAHTGVDVLLCELGVVALAVVVELGEYVVPNLHEAVAVAAGLTVGRATAVLDSAVEVDLGARTAGTRAVLPEVISLAEANDALCGNADLIVPDVEGLLVLLVDRGPEKLCGDLEGYGKEFPSPSDSLLLEVVAEGEVAEHFEECTVTRGVTYALKVGGTDALLTGGNAVAGRNLLAGEELLHRRHTRVDEQKRLVVMRNEGIGRQTEVTLGFKESQVLLTNVVK